jgi:UDP-glucuronate 4-epimerase
MNNKERILVTGCAGFIGMHLCDSLLKDGYQVLGIDNLNSYYDVSLKYARLEKIKNYKCFNFLQLDITNGADLRKAFSDFKPDKVVNLAAQAGVRYSLENPQAYIDSNIVGFMNMLECVRHYNVKGLIYASSSSVYGKNKKSPFSVKDRADSPISIYAATKKANELMAHTYSHLYGMHTTGLRFFTVYGPWGRPDMAMYIFSDKISRCEDISVFNFGRMRRDFTYIDDIIKGIVSSIKNNYECEVFNLGNQKSEDLKEMIKLIEKSLNKNAKINYKDMQPGDVESTYADIEYSKEKLGFDPSVSISEGIPLFVKWFLSYNS